MEPLSARNPRVQQLRRLVRQSKTRNETGLFVLEGAGLVAEALSCGLVPIDVFVSGSGDADALVEELEQAGSDLWVLEADVLESIASTVSPQPMLATVSMGQTSLVDAVDQETSLVLVAVGVNDPGNAGTLIRTAAGAGAQAVVFCGDSVDVFNPKVVRASAGALFRVPVVAGVETTETWEHLGACGVTTIGLAGDAPSSYDEIDLTARVAVVFGNEAHGLGAEDAAALDRLVSIPMAAGVESINVAAAAAAVCFEISRQRRRGPGRARPGAPAPRAGHP